VDPILFQAGGVFAALALIGYAVMSFFTGAAHANGAVLREGLKPALESIRANSEKSRGDLADASLMIGVALAVGAMLLESPFVGAILAIAMMAARGTIQKVSASEHPLMALGSQFSADLTIGVIVPMSLAHLLMGNWLIASSQLALSVSLSWPTGGPGRRSGAWKPSWVGA
jgi:hypothetical protein